MSYTKSICIISDEIYRITWDRLREIASTLRQKDVYRLVYRVCHTNHVSIEQWQLFFKQLNPEKIVMFDAVIPCNETSAFRKMIYTWLLSVNKLEVLRLKDSKLKEVDVVAILCKLPSIEVLSLNNIQSNVLISEYMPRLKELYITYQSIDNDVLVAMTRVLPRCSKLKHFIIRAGITGFYGQDILKEFMRTLAKVSTLQTIGLNFITLIRDPELILHFIHQLPKLQHLIVDVNIQTGDEFRLYVDAIANHLYIKSVEFDKFGNTANYIPSDVVQDCYAYAMERLKGHRSLWNFHVDRRYKEENALFYQLYRNREKISRVLVMIRFGCKDKSSMMSQVSVELWRKLLEFFQI